MNKHFRLFLLPILVVLAGCFKNDTPVQNIAPITNVDNIEVVHFHSNRQCQSCVAIGELSQKAIKEGFPQEYSTGKIVFKQVNIDLPENKNIVAKFRARNSALFFNVTKDHAETIIEDTKVWRLVGDESEFINYITTTIKRYLGK